MIYDEIARCFPGTHITPQRVENVLKRNDAVILTEQVNGATAGLAVYEKDHIQLLCVFPAYRNMGIGSKLLAQAESAIANNGYSKAKCYAGDDYITPGVPEYPDNWDFFRKRGYFHSWEDSECLDMSVLQEDAPEIREMIGSVIKGYKYRIASFEDLSKIKTCVDDACEEFTQYYLNPSLYRGHENAFVLVAEHADEICGTLIVERDESRSLGSVGCTATANAHQGHGIATNMIRIATAHLFNTGLRECWLGYTYTSIVNMYSRAGYKPCMRYMMAEKKLVSCV